MMKRKMLLAGLSSLVFSPFAIAATYTQTVESYSPIGYFQFSSQSGGQTSSAVNGYVGTLKNGATIGGVGAVVDDDFSTTALVLNNPTGSSTQYMDTNLPGTTTANQVSSAGTIIAWINLAQLPSSTGRIFYVAGESTSGDDFDLQIQTDNKLYFYSDSGSATVSPTAFTAADLNKWIFVAGAFTKSTINGRSVYINGSDVATSTPGGHSASSNPFSVGESDVFGGRHFNGMIDDVAVYNTQLTDAQIAAIYNSATNPVPEPTSVSLFIGAATLFGLRRRAR